MAFAVVAFAHIRRRNNRLTLPWNIRQSLTPEGVQVVVLSYDALFFLFRPLFKRHPTTLVLRLGESAIKALSIHAAPHTPLCIRVACGNMTLLLGLRGNFQRTAA